MADKTVSIPATVIPLWEAFEAATDHEEKQALAMQITEEFCDYYDGLDPEAPQAISRLCDEFEQARMGFVMSGTRLAMYLIEVLRNTRATAKQRESAN
jgi:hypothetical protein